MTQWIATILIAVFAILGLWHVGMAFGVGSMASGAVPSVEGKALFVPSRSATLGVAFVLFLFAALIATTSGMLRPGLPRALLTWSCYALAFGLAARAVGDFKHVGFFKSVHGSRFAQLDTMVFSPLCLVLAVGVFYLAYSTALE